MKKNKVLKILISFCTFFAMSFTVFAKDKTQNLKEVFKNNYGYKEEFVTTLDLLKHVENSILKNEAKEKNKDISKKAYKFGTCLGFLLKESKNFTEQKKDFKEFINENFVEKKFDFINYDKTVFNQLKKYFEQAEEKFNLMNKNFYNTVDKKSSKDLKYFINMNFIDLMLTIESINNDLAKKIKKDFKNKNSEFYKSFIKETKKYLEYLNTNFKISVELLKKFENDKNMRVKVNNEIKKINLKDVMSILFLH